MPRRLVKPYEFWHPRLFETPYYLYLLYRCAVRRLPFKFLAKANYALDHGEIGVGSKLATQHAFAQDRFLPAVLITDAVSIEERHRISRDFAARHGFPLVLKPDIGSVGKGVTKVRSDEELVSALGTIRGPYILQVFCTGNVEFGVFFVRHNGQPRITGINRKHFPTILGNGRDSIQVLAERHYRFTSHWRLFLASLDTSRVPAAGESVQLSFIGSHTMGCKFTDDTHRKTPALERAIFEICDSQPGFNFGRLDVKTDSEADFLAGKFSVIEINGIASLPTQMFDPAGSLAHAYRIFLHHGYLLVEIANEHRDKPMQLASWKEIVSRVRANRAMLEATHEGLMTAPATVTTAK